MGNSDRFLNDNFAKFSKSYILHLSTYLKKLNHQDLANIVRVFLKKKENNKTIYFIYRVMKGKSKNHLLHGTETFPVDVNLVLFQIKF